MAEEETDDDDIIGESSEYSRKAEFKKPLLVQEAMQKIAISRSKEMRPGYINTSRSSDGTITQVTIPDARQEYVNSVKYIILLLNPEIMLDAVSKPKLSIFKTKEKELFEKCAYQEIKAKKEGTKIEMIKTDYKFIPAMDAVLETETYNMDKKEFVFAKGYWNNKVSYYWEEMIRLCDDMLEEINTMLHRLDYFKGKEQW